MADRIARAMDDRPIEKGIAALVLAAVFIFGWWVNAQPETKADRCRHYWAVTEVHGPDRWGERAAERWLKEDC